MNYLHVDALAKIHSLKTTLATRDREIAELQQERAAWLEQKRALWAELEMAEAELIELTDS